MRPLKRFGCALIFALILGTIFSSSREAFAQTTVTINATNTGWYSNTGFHNSMNANYLAGQISNGTRRAEFHNYFVFDLSGIQGTITNATLKVLNPQFGYFSNYPTQTYTVFDVSTPVAQVIADAGNQDPPLNPQPPLRPDIFSDLGAGASYGSIVVRREETDTVVSTSLNADGVGALNSVRGLIALGGALTSLHQDQYANEYVFAGSGDTNNAVQLELTVVSGNPTPTFSINDVSLAEGNTGERDAVFTVHRTGLATQPTTINYATADGTATEGSDYQSASGALTFQPDETSKTINVKIFGDTSVEPDETFFVNLSTTDNATIARAQGVGTILNDDAPTININDVTVNEGSNPNNPTTAQFTVSLNAPSVNPITVQFATTDGTATSPSDYSSTSGTLLIPAGSTTATINVFIRPDTAVEPNETFTVTLTNPVNAVIARGVGVGTILNDDEAAYAGQILITEFRPRGANGALDEFVELYNNTDAAITVITTDGSSGWALAASDGIARFIIPNGTTIPARAHVLGVNSLGYSLAAYPAGEGNTAVGDFTFTADIPDNSGIAFFRSATNFTAATRLDAAGFDSSATLYFEGTPLPSTGTANGQYSFVRNFLIANTFPRDVDDNVKDFSLVATVAGSYGAMLATLGAPGPENLHSPIAHSGRGVSARYLDPMRCASCAPNRALTTETINGSPTSVLKIRRTIVNNTAGNITRLRFRVIDITTLHSPVIISPQADLRVISSVDEAIPLLTGETKTARQLTREEPPDQTSTTLDGGLNTTLSAGTITLAQPLAPGDSISVNFWLRKVTGGNFRFYINIETLP